LPYFRSCDSLILTKTRPLRFLVLPPLSPYGCVQVKIFVLAKALFASVLVMLGIVAFGMTQSSDDHDLRTALLSKMEGSGLAGSWASKMVPSFQELKEAALLPPLRAETARPAVLKVDAQPKSGCRRLSSGETLAVGDQVSLRVFERSEQAEGGDMAFERLDLGGTFVIDQKGSVALPLVGRVEAEALDLACFETEVGRALFDETRSEMRVSASILSRQQVIVQGAVARPGAYTHLPAMTVEKLLALAGSVGDTTATAAKQAALLNARLDELERLSVGVALEQKRVEAMLEGRSEISLEGPVRFDLEKRLGANRTAVEIAALRAGIEAHEVTAVYQDLALADLDAQAQEAKTQLQRIEDQVQNLTRRRAEIEDLHARGVVSAGALDDAVANLMAAERSRFDMFSRIFQIETSRQQIEREAAVGQANHRYELARQMRDLAEERNALEGQISSLRVELAFAQPAGSAGMFDVTIRRLENGRTVRFPADLATEVRPGDMIDIRMSDPNAPMELANDTWSSSFARETR
jgi:protein involved in polysaccharide export with SLBB domain